MPQARTTPMADGTTRTAWLELSDVPSDAAPHAARAHEAAALVAEKCGFLRDAEAHRELAAQMRQGRPGLADGGRTA